MSAFLREVLVNYASNMITEYWTVAPSFENNEHFCMVLIICKSSFAKAGGAIHMFILSFFVNHNFSWDRNTAWKMPKYGVFSGPYFSSFGLNTERYFVSLRIQSECGKIRTRKNFVFGHISHSGRRSRYANGFSICFSTLNEISFCGLPSNSKRPSIRKQIVVIVTVNSLSTASRWQRHRGLKEAEPSAMYPHG